jgi:argininosuccinate synthase
MAMKVVLAYSGGLDTSVAIPWLKEMYDAQVIAVTVNLGGGKAQVDVEARALVAGAIKALTVEAREAFVEHFVFPTLQAGAVYQGQYPLATALGRPLIARLLVEVAQRESAQAVAHGCTGKGNDQVRFDLGITTLDPSLRIIAPAREWNMTREEEIQYAQSRDVSLEFGKRNPYSIDENLWGRSIEAGNLEDPWQEPSEEAFTMTRSPENAPQTPRYLEVSFEKGLPVVIDGDEMNGVALVQHLNSVAGEHGVGRIDHLEDRLVGIKSREVYEAPAAVVLHAAHRALESITLSREQLRFKEKVAQEYAELVYNGLWYTAFHRDLDAYVKSTQRYVTGTVRVKLFKGSCTVVGRSSPYSLYQHDLATYDEGDIFDHRSSEGFIHIYGLPGRTQARSQSLDIPELGTNG